MLAGLILYGTAITPENRAPRQVGIVAARQRHADWMPLLLEFGAADPEIVPGVGEHADLVPQILAVHAWDVDVVIGIGRPGLGIQVECDLLADGAGLAELLLNPFDKTRQVDKVTAIEMRSAGAVPHEQVVSGLRRHFGCRARRDVLFGNM